MPEYMLGLFVFPFVEFERRVLEDGTVEIVRFTVNAGRKNFGREAG